MYEFDVVTIIFAVFILTIVILLGGLLFIISDARQNQAFRDCSVVGSQGYETRVVFHVGGFGFGFNECWINQGGSWITYGKWQQIKVV